MIFKIKCFRIAVIGFLGFSSMGLASGIPQAPIDLVATAAIQGDLAVTLWWADLNNDEKIFEVERCEGLFCTDFRTISERNSKFFGTWFNDVGLSENTSYSYRVRSRNESGQSEYTNTVLAKTSFARPRQISDLVGSFLSEGVLLRWIDRAGNETRFEVERYEIGNENSVGFETIAVLEPNIEQYVDSNVKLGRIYRYRIVPYRYDVYGGAPETVVIPIY